jgi:hypothetical protein
MMEAVRISETSVYFYGVTRRYIPEGCHLHTSCRENLKCHNLIICLSNTHCNILQRGSWWNARWIWIPNMKCNNFVFERTLKFVYRLCWGSFNASVFKITELRYRHSLEISQCRTALWREIYRPGSHRDRFSFPVRLLSWLQFFTSLC